MTSSIAVDPVYERIVGVIRAQVVAELVLLFGSRADGRAHEDSDYDLIVVLPDVSDVERERRQISYALYAAGIAADVRVRSVSEYEQHQSDPGFVDWLASRSGVLLYSSGMVPRLSPRAPRVHEQPSEGLRRWIERAAEDFRAADWSLSAPDPPIGPICFHAHACIEKLLKAMIVLRGEYPPRTHDLSQLLLRLAPPLRDDRRVIEASALLESVYAGSRYPDQPMPSLDDARRAVDSARAVRDIVLPLLGINYGS